MSPFQRFHILHRLALLTLASQGGHWFKTLPLTAASSGCKVRCACICALILWRSGSGLLPYLKGGVIMHDTSVSALLEALADEVGWDAAVEVLDSIFV